LIVTWDVLVIWPPPEEEGIIVPRVLVVDDDPMVCVAIEVCLTRKGFEVTVADGGEAGMRALESSDFDGMLIDVFRPRMRRIDSIRMFHERRPDVPIVAMSGYAFANTERAPDFLRMTIELGAACCLRKPFTPDALAAKVREVLETQPAPSAPGAPESANRGAPSNGNGAGAPPASPPVKVPAATPTGTIVQRAEDVGQNRPSRV